MKTKRVHEMTAGARRFRQQVARMLKERIGAHDTRCTLGDDPTSRVMRATTRDILAAVEAMR